jgi:hypothetical protein
MRSNLFSGPRIDPQNTQVLNQSSRGNHANPSPKGKLQPALGKIFNGFRSDNIRKALRLPAP